MSTRYPDLNLTTFPDVIDNIATMMDIQQTDLPMVNLYQSALRSGDFDQALVYLGQISNSDRKIISAVKFNQIRDAILAVERFYQSDIYPYLETKQIEWKAYIDLFVYRGIYNNSTVYYKNNIVDYIPDSNFGTSYLYICTANAPVGTIPTNVAYWRRFTVQGDRGESGDESAYLFDWSSTYTYKQTDAVTYANIMWSSLTNDNLNNVPAVGNPNWKILMTNALVSFPMQSVEPIGQTVGELWFEV